MDIVLNKDLILLNMKASNRFELLEKVADNLHQMGYVKNTYKEAVINREKIFATGLPTLVGGVAIPHTDIQHVNIPAISIARLLKPVNFVIMGDDTNTVPVNLIFMLAMKEEHAQLELLQRLMGILQSEEDLKFLQNEESVDKIKEFVSKKLQLKN